MNFSGRRAGIKVSRASVLSLHRLPHYQAQSGPLTRHERKERASGAAFLAMIVRGQKRPRYASFKGSFRVLPSFLLGSDQVCIRRTAASRLIEGT